MKPDEIASQMTGLVTPQGDTQSAILRSPAIQNHAAFLAPLAGGDLACAWFGGSLEGKSDISIYASILPEGADTWSPPSQLSDQSDRSEQNPVIFTAPDGQIWLFNTAQPHGNQDESRVYMRKITRAGTALQSGAARDIGLPLGTFIRAPITVRDDGAWMLPLFICNPRDGLRWTGAFDTAALAISTDSGATWTVTHVPASTGSVHMTPVPLNDGNMAAFYRRRQSDWVHRSESTDDGRTWSTPQPTDVPNNNSSIGVCTLADGTLAMVCNPISAAQSQSRRTSLYDELEDVDDRPDTQPNDAEGQIAPEGCTPIWGVERAPLSLCLSSDGGKTFTRRHVIETSTGACLTNDSIDGKNQELSYPMILPRKDGGLDIAFTLHRRAIKHIRISPQALADIRATRTQEGT
ncbi:sialidase family protein [Pacificibacter marinus]|uniref:Sialidase domain-containing protein n=1 Tax=Pacificibacter marinus TaxID=658057 RepID=A0A1Y5RN34_9RHOB|nr:exo-alpha-sialidase [Pacificibacter marinus]SEK18363.1 Predicted neuraminidase (sialidase) [Pacificibacter marinus]SLN18767.1 hypothetical protein PAM7971_00501 [Pacificibacter marinus]